MLRILTERPCAKMATPKSNREQSRVRFIKTFLISALVAETSPRNSFAALKDASMIGAGKACSLAPFAMPVDYRA
jgi:hypothetical protein